MKLSEFITGSSVKFQIQRNNIERSKPIKYGSCKETDHIREKLNCKINLSYTLSEKRTIVKIVQDILENIERYHEIIV